MYTEILIGLVGLVLGALIGFFGDLYLNKRKEKFEAYKDVRETLNKMYSDLVIGHSNIQKFYVENRDKKHIENILELKKFHWKVMEIYKEFRIYFGNLNAYELQSAIYNYYYEYAKIGIEKEDETKFYEMCYQALRDAYGLMLNDVKLGLASVKFISEANDNLRIDKKESYLKYSKRIKESLDNDIKSKGKNFIITENETPLSKAFKTLEERVLNFEKEYNKIYESYTMEMKKNREETSN
jgi:hypothetical protein